MSTANCFVLLEQRDGQGASCGATGGVWREGGFGYRIRGMAVDEAYRGYGFGRRLMEACQDLAKQLETGLWCNARNIAIPAYVACGFAQVEEEFDIPNIGPHYVLEWLPFPA